MTEEQLQNRCVLWFDATFHAERKMLFHVDNNSWNKIIGSRKKALGVRDGVSDMILITFGETIYIEMKTEIGTQSDAQIEFQTKVIRRGHRYIIIRSFEQFTKLIYESLGNNQ